VAGDVDTVSTLEIDVLNGVQRAERALQPGLPGIESAIDPHLVLIAHQDISVFDADAVGLVVFHTCQGIDEAVIQRAAGYGYSKRQDA
jgi:hypothetical protein